MRKVVIALFVILLIAHQDFWAWNDATLVFGFMPIGLFYHAMFAVASALLGALAIRYMWPDSAHTDGEVAPPKKDTSKVEIGEADLDLL